MKKVIGLFSPLVNYYIILEIRIKTPTLIKFVSLEFLEIRNSFMENLNIVKTIFYFNFISVIKICN